MGFITSLLGFRQPDRRELIKNLAGFISHNATKTEEHLLADRDRIGFLEGKTNSLNGSISTAYTGAIRESQAYTDAEVGKDRARLGAVESKNTQQDLAITDARSSALAGAKTYTDAEVGKDRIRLTAVEAKNTSQDTAIAEARTGATGDAKTYTDAEVGKDRTRLTAVEAKNTSQDTAISALTSRGFLASNANLNNLKALADVGVYTLYADATTSGLPAGLALPSRLTFEVLRGGPFSVYQRISSAGGPIFERAIKTGSADTSTFTWGDWVQLVFKTDLAPYALLSRGFLANNTNLNTLVSAAAVGVYTLFGDNTTVGLPAGVAGRVTIEVVRGGQFSVLQYVTTTTATTYTRAVQSGDANAGSQVWSEWVQLTNRTDVALLSRGYLPNETDLNAFVAAAQVGTYTLYGDDTTLGLPLSVLGRVTFELLRGGQFSVVQRLTTAAGIVFSRSVQSGDANAGTHAWSGWAQSANQADGAVVLRGYLPNDTDISALAAPQDVGIYTLYGDTTTRGLPESISGRLTVEVVHGGKFSVVQRLTTAEGIAYSRAVQTGDASIGTQVWSRWMSASEAPKSSRTRICMIGDSLIDSHNLPESVGAALPKVTVYNRGWNGNTTDSIAVRMGTLETYWKVAGDIIPAEAGSSVPVATSQVLAFRNGLNSYGGWLAGVYGSLYSDNGVDFVFKRQDAGSAVTVGGITKFISWIAPNHRTDTLGLLLGRNDVSIKAKGLEPSVVEHVLANTAKFVNEFMTPQIKQFFILGTVNATSEVTGTVENKMVRDMNERIAQLWPGHFLDLRTYLVTRAIYDLGIAPTAADLDAMSKDAPPPSVMEDDVHFSDEAATAIADNLIVPWLLGKGYVDL